MLESYKEALSKLDLLISGIMRQTPLPSTRPFPFPNVVDI